jgi:hypothetical protein
MIMAASSNSEIVNKLLETPSLALSRKFASLGYSLLLRLQSELTAIEAHSGEALMARIEFLQMGGATEVFLSSEFSTEERRLEEELHRKLIKYCTQGVALHTTD